MKAKIFKAVHTDAYPGRYIKEEVEELNKIGAELILAHCKTEEEVIEACKNSDAILTSLAPITQRVIDSLERCLVISRYGIGYDNIDVEAATRNGIIITYTPGFCVEEVSTHAITLLLACVRKLVILNNGTKRGGWDHFPSPMAAISGQSLGLIGCGQIGRTVAAKARCFGLRLLGYDPYADKAVTEKYGINLLSLNDLLKESDYVSLHTPLNNETYHLIGEKELKMMKSSAYLINTSRGSVVDEQVLIKALENKWIAGAGLDVFEKEPPEANNPLLKMDNVVVTPHTAFYSDASFRQVRMRVGEAVRNVLSGVWPK
ncbi:MAG: C-terminal binding protein, partial [Dehalococcoidia bacterium]